MGQGEKKYFFYNNLKQIISEIIYFYLLSFSYPYFCIACYGTGKLTSVRTAGELIRHVREANHTKDDFHLVMIPSNMHSSSVIEFSAKNRCNDIKK